MKKYNRYARFYAVAKTAKLATDDHWKAHRNAALKAYFGWDINSLTELSDTQLDTLCDSIEGGAFRSIWMLSKQVNVMSATQKMQLADCL